MIKEPSGESKNEGAEISNTPEREKSDLLKRLEEVVNVASPNVATTYAGIYSKSGSV